MAFLARSLRPLLRPLLRSASSCDPAVLELQQLDLTTFRPLPPTHGPVTAFARYSDCLRSLLGLGVSLHAVGRQPEVLAALAKADFDRDIAPVVRLLVAAFHLEMQDVADVLSRLPELLLPGRLTCVGAVKDYLQEAGFSEHDITRLVAGNASLLLTPPEELDHFLELLQQTFVLTGSEVRQVALSDPLVLSVPPDEVRVLAGTFLKSLGFSLRQLHGCVLSAPSLLRRELQVCAQNFKLLHARLGLSHEVLAANAVVLGANFRMLKERVLFLQSSGRAQFDPKQPLYTPPRILAARTDEEFCAELPGVDIQLYNSFLRSL